MKIDLKGLTIAKAHEHLKKGDFTAVELTKSYLDEIAVKDKGIHAYLEVFDDVLDQAKAADQEIKAAISAGKDFNMLLGIPLAVKDNILIKGRIASSASKILEKYHATCDAKVISKLKEAGVVFLGRTNMDEFAMGGSTENSAYGVTKNPHDLDRVAGGSSGGSAAAVAMDGALFALGSDTGGSIRQPASFCGVVGLKPTYGAVSRYGVMAMGSSLDQIGPITKTVGDAEIVFDAIRGIDIKDGTTIEEPRTKNQDTNKSEILNSKFDLLRQRVSMASPLRQSDSAARTNSQFPISNSQSTTKKPVIGVPRRFLGGDGIDPAVMKAFDAAIDSFKAKGYEIKEVELPHISYALMVYYVVMPAEVSSNMARFDGMRYGLHVGGKDGIEDYFLTRRAGLGREVIRRILLGTYVLSSGYYDAYYNRANAVRRMITDDFIKAFGGVDIIATPTAPSPAWKIGEKENDPVAMYLEDIFTVTANLTGLPAISIPCGFAPRLDIGTKGKGPTSLPIGLQLTARHGDESTLFQAGKEFLGE